MAHCESQTTYIEITVYAMSIVIIFEATRKDRQTLVDLCLCAIASLFRTPPVVLAPDMSPSYARVIWALVDPNAGSQSSAIPNSPGARPSLRWRVLRIGFRRS